MTNPNTDKRQWINQIQRWFYEFKESKNLSFEDFELLIKQFKMIYKPQDIANVVTDDIPVFKQKIQGMISNAYYRIVDFSIIPILDAVYEIVEPNNQKGNN